MRKIASSVFVETGWKSGTSASAGSNSGFVITTDGIVMIDAPQVPGNALKWLDIIRERGKLIYLINTEFHADHTMGDYFFPATIISHEETRKAIPDALLSPDYVREIVRDRYPDNVHLVENYEIRLPSLTFSERLILNFGGHTFEMIHLPGHTLGQICVRVPEEGVVFTGDNFSNGFQPALSYCYPFDWLRSLDKLLNYDCEFFVPGHGEIGVRKDVIRFRDFLAYCIETVSHAVVTGMTRDEIINTIEFEELLPPRHPGRDQQKRNIARLYDMTVSGHAG